MSGSNDPELVNLLKMREFVDATKKASELDLGSELHKFKRMRDALRAGILEQPTALVGRAEAAKTRWDRMMQVVHSRAEALKHSHAKLAADMNDLRDLSKQLDAIDSPFTKETWLDVAESWQALANLIPKMEAERCQGVLGCIFADEAVLKGLGAAKQFEGIVGDPPHGVLLLLKHGPGAHLKANRYDYQKALSKEVARIERIKELRTQMLGLICTAIASAFFTVGSFLGRGIYNYLGPERSFFPLASDVSLDY